jgi:leucyl/phenylalanyl-tRNA--protein transferase
MNLALLDPDHPQFPDPSTALSEPDGLLAVGGNLDPSTLVDAYRQGIFPWYQDEDPILWWSPATRCLIEPKALNISRRLRRLMRQQPYQIKTDSAFSKVMRACAEPRGDGGTWITEDMMASYTALHDQGQAHCVEVWDGSNLVGGIYGVHLGGIFCGESMFSRVDNGSKIAIAHLCQWMTFEGLELIDCQMINPHLLSLGAISMARPDFLAQLHNLRDRQHKWSLKDSFDWEW